MAKDDKEKTEKQEIKEEMAEVVKKDEPTFHVDEHIELAYPMYDEPAHVVAGAISLLPGNKKNYTKSEMRVAISNFKKHKVQ